MPKIVANVTMRVWRMKSVLEVSVWCYVPTHKYYVKAVVLLSNETQTIAEVVLWHVNRDSYVSKESVSVWLHKVSVTMYAWT